MVVVEERECEFEDDDIEDGEEGEEEEGGEFEFGMERMGPQSVPASPRYKMSGIATPGDIGTLTEEVSRVPLFLSFLVLSFRLLGC